MESPYAPPCSTTTAACSTSAAYPPLPQDLQELLAPHIQTRQKPGKTPFPAISLAGTNLLAAHLQISPTQAMIFALEHDLWPLRFAAGRGTLSPLEQARLLRSHAVVVGCGGLGGTVIMLLARWGLGALTVCDPDVFDETNLNRQHLAREDRLGKNKALAAAEELAAVASHVTVRTFPCRAHAGNAPEILQGAHVVLDCLDSLPDRFVLEQAAHAAGLPFIHGAIAGLEGFVGPSTPEHPLLPRLYGPTPPTHSAEAVSGSPTPTPAIVACLQVLTAVNILLGKAGPELLRLDLAVPELELLHL